MSNRDKESETGKAFWRHANDIALLIIMGCCLFAVWAVVRLYPVIMRMASLMEMVLGR